MAAPARLAGALVAAALLLAGCTDGDGPSPDPSDSGSPTAAPSASPTSDAGPTASPSPSPEPTGPATVEVVSQHGTITAAVPDGWVPCDDAATRASSTALDVLGAWAVAGTCEGDRVATVESVESSDSGLTADEYYDSVFAMMAEDSAIEFTHVIFVNPAGYEVLLVTAADAESPDPRADATFIAFAGRVLVVGKLPGVAGSADPAVDQFREVARTVDVR